MDFEEALIEDIVGKEEATPPALPSTPQISLSLDDLKSVLIQALAPIQQQVQNLSDELAQVKQESEASRDNVPQAGRKSDPNVRWSDHRIARRATVATRAATDNPDDYQHIVDSSSVSQRGGN